jgi:hypothetical protein
VRFALNRPRVMAPRSCILGSDVAGDTCPGGFVPAPGLAAADSLPLDALTEDNLVSTSSDLLRAMFKTSDPGRAAWTPR